MVTKKMQLNKLIALVGTLFLALGAVSAEGASARMSATGDYKLPEKAYVISEVPGYNSWPMIQAVGTKLFCSYSRDNARPPNGHTINPGSRDSYLRLSVDGGRTWSDEITVADDPKIGEVNEGIGLDETGAAILWVRCWGKDRRHELYRTVDGKTIEKVATIRPDPFPMQIMDPVRVEGLGLVSPWFAGNYRENGANSWGLFVSVDNGRTWTQRIVEKELPLKEWVTEPSLADLGGGRLLIVGRCEKSLGNQFQVTSVDGGKTWKKARTNIGDVRESTPSLVYDATSGLVANYYYHRGARQLKRRVVQADFIFDHPDRWPEPEVLAVGFEQRPHDAGNVKATRLGDKDCCAWYTGTQSNATVVVTVVPKPACTTDAALPRGVPPRAGMECVAHRGYWSSAVPENTVEAITRAYDCGADWVETDFNLMPDGKMLCFHDPKTRDRTMKPPFHVPTLEEVLAVVPKDRHIQCEIKTYGKEYAAKFDAAVKAAGLTPDNIIVSCFNPTSLKDFKRQMPQYRTLWLIGPKRLQTEGKGIDIDGLIATAKDIGAFAMCPAAKGAYKAKWSRAEADRIRAAGFSFRFFGVNEPKMLAYAADLGVEAFTCNFYEDAFRWARQSGVRLNPPKERKINLTAAFPASVKTIGVVMPASIFPKQHFDAISAALVAAGYRLKVAPRINFENVAPAADRAKDFEEAWMDPEVDLVICARGGKGSEEILPLLDWNRLRTRKQKVLGFSNITCILNAMAKEDAGEPFSGPTMSQFRYCDVPTLTWLNATIAREKMPEVKLLPLRGGACEGLACGGHISLFLSMVKAGRVPPAKGRIVFLECVNRTPEAVKGELAELVARGYFKDAAGVVFGDITSGKRGSKGQVQRGFAEQVAEIKRAFAEQVTCPVFDAYPYGHVSRSFAIDFNRRHRITAEGVLTLE